MFFKFKWIIPIATLTGVWFVMVYRYSFVI